MNSLPLNYLTLPAQEKQQLLWKNIVQSKYSTDVLPESTWVRFMWDAVSGGLFGKQFLRKTLLHDSDELPDGRRRLIHSFGSVCLLTFEPVPGNSFSGTLSSGACGLLRVSLTLPAVSFTPGFAVKFLIDGQPSLNPKKLRWNYLPLDHFAATRSDGTKETNPVVPHELIFLPTPDAQLSRESEVDYRLRLRDIAPGTVIYQVLATDSPTSRPILIGHMRTASEFVASHYGDEKIFFQHDPGPH